MAGQRQNVLLVSMPVSAPRYPSLALGLLKAGLHRAGIGCDVRYFSLDYAGGLGESDYRCISDDRTYTAMLGDWIFAEAAHEDDPAAMLLASDPRDYLTRVFAPKCPPKERAARLGVAMAARDGASEFIDQCVESVAWHHYGVLGVTTSFQQNMASLAFARRVKAHYPDILIVFGGANCQGEMGIALHRHYPFIDAICLGEGDRTLPELVRRHYGGESLAGLPGFVVRDGDASNIPAEEVDQIDDLDTLPYPDFSEFYAQRANLPDVAKVPPAVMFETARGCWWGAKHHCTFCGLNGRMMSYRSKSPARAYDELRHLVARHGNDVVNADAILDLRYFSNFVPRLGREGPALRMFWQMKANIRPYQLALLSRAGVKRIQPGIEALDTELLALMRKGCTMLQNIQILKLAAECGLSVAWNLLYGFPGEDPLAYSRTARLLPKLRHLQPPVSSGRVFADRFSPYFQQSEAFGVRLAPIAAYRYLYPLDEAELRDLAYHFHMRSAALDNAETVAAPMKAEQSLWRKHSRDSALYAEDVGDGVIVTDTRWGREASVRTYAAAEAGVLRLCWQITALHTLHARLGAHFTRAEITAAVESLIGRDLLVGEGSEFIALVLRQPGYRRAPTWGDILRDELIPYALRDPAGGGFGASDAEEAGGGPLGGVITARAGPV